MRARRLGARRAPGCSETSNRSRVAAGEGFFALFAMRVLAAGVSNRSHRLCHGHGRIVMSRYAGQPLWSDADAGGLSLEMAVGTAFRNVRKPRSLRPGDRRLRGPAPGLGAADRVRARLRRVARLHLAADSGLGGAGRHRRADQFGRAQLLAGLDRGLRSAPPSATGCPTGSAESSNIACSTSGRSRAIPT